jgi:tetratricopeptide (TPR) repeat protein
MLNRFSYFFIVFTTLLVSGCASQPQKDNIPVEIPQEFLDSSILVQWKIANKYYQENNWPKSYQLYKKMLETQSTDAELWFRLGVSSARQGKQDEAESAFENTLKYSPNHQKSLYNLAVINLSKGYVYLQQYLLETPPDKRDPQLEAALSTLEKFTVE